MIELTEIATFDLVFRIFAMVYLAVVAVDFFQWIPWTKLGKDVHGNTVKIRVLDEKPFNCVKCMFFWVGIPAVLLPVSFLLVFSLAGMALFLYKIMNRSEIFGA